MAESFTILKGIVLFSFLLYKVMESIVLVKKIIIFFFIFFFNYFFYYFFPHNSTALALLLEIQKKRSIHK